MRGEQSPFKLLYDKVFTKSKYILCKIQIKHKNAVNAETQEQATILGRTNMNQTVGTAMTKQWLMALVAKKSQTLTMMSSLSRGFISSNQILY